MNSNEHRRQFDDFLTRQRGRLVAIARVYAGTEHEDLLQEILLQVWKSLSGFEQRSSMDTWAYRVAINTSLQWRRSAARRKKPVGSDSFDIEQVSGQRDSDPDRQLDRLLQSLPEPDKALLIMHLDNLSYQQMSEVLGITEQAIRVRMHRMKKKIEQGEGFER